MTNNTSDIVFEIRRKGPTIKHVASLYQKASGPERLVLLRLTADYLGEDMIDTRREIEIEVAYQNK